MVNRFEYSSTASSAVSTLQVNRRSLRPHCAQNPALGLPCSRSTARTAVWPPGCLEAEGDFHLLERTGHARCRHACCVTPSHSRRRRNLPQDDCQPAWTSTGAAMSISTVLALSILTGATAAGADSLPTGDVSIERTSCSKDEVKLNVSRTEARLVPEIDVGTNPQASQRSPALALPAQFGAGVAGGLIGSALGFGLGFALDVGMLHASAGDVGGLAGALVGALVGYMVGTLVGVHVASRLLGTESSVLWTILGTAAGFIGAVGVVAVFGYTWPALAIGGVLPIIGAVTGSALSVSAPHPIELAGTRQVVVWRVQF